MKDGIEKQIRKEQRNDNALLKVVVSDDVSVVV